MEGGASIPGGGCRPDHCIRGGREGGREGREGGRDRREKMSYYQAPDCAFVPCSSRACEGKVCKPMASFMCCCSTIWR